MIQIQMTKEKYDAAIAEATAKGVKFGTDGSTASYLGAEVAYSFDGTTFTATCTHAPWPLSKGFCENKLKASLGIA